MYLARSLSSHNTDNNRQKINLVRLWTITKFHNQKIKGINEHHYIEILKRQILQVDINQNTFL